MIHNILTGSSLNFKSATHKLCLYNGIIDGHPIFLLRQVDDFTVAAPSNIIANKLFTILQSHLKQPLKLLGILTMFNGLNVTQSNKFICLSCSTYIQKILEGYNWQRLTRQSPISTPMNHDKVYMSQFEQASGPTDIIPRLILEKRWNSHTDSPLANSSLQLSPAGPTYYIPSSTLPIQHTPCTHPLPGS